MDKQNILYAAVHNDESTPHMHVGVCSDHRGSDDWLQRATFMGERR